MLRFITIDGRSASHTADSLGWLERHAVFVDSKPIDPLSAEALLVYHAVHGEAPTVKGQQQASDEVSGCHVTPYHSVCTTARRLPRHCLPGIQQMLPRLVRPTIS